MLAGLTQTDMLNLRSLLIISSTCGIAYNLTQPKPLYAPACWGIAFLSIHFYMIATLLRERQELSLTHDEEEIYSRSFSRYGFTRQQFMDVLQVATPRWCNFSRGEFIYRRGGDFDELPYLVEGEVEIISATGDPMKRVRPGKGSWLGEFFSPNLPADYWDKSQSHHWCVSCKCTAETCRIMLVPRRKLYEVLSSNPRLKEAATAAAVGDVWGKYIDTICDMRRIAYQSLIDVALADGVLHPTERDMLAQYKQRHKISDEDHLAILKKTGWTAEEFQAGRKKRSARMF